MLRSSSSSRCQKHSDGEVRIASAFAVLLVLDRIFGEKSELLLNHKDETQESKGKPYKDTVGLRTKRLRFAYSILHIVIYY